MYAPYENSLTPLRNSALKDSHRPLTGCYAGPIAIRQEIGRHKQQSLAEAAPYCETMNVRQRNAYLRRFQTTLIGGPPIDGVPTV